MSKNTITVKIKRDVNGNKVASVKIGEARAFSIQTMGTLPYIHNNYVVGESFAIVADKSAFYPYFEGKDIAAYIYEHGTKRQKQLLCDCF